MVETTLRLTVAAVLTLATEEASALYGPRGSCPAAGTPTAEPAAAAELVTDAVSTLCAVPARTALYSSAAMAARCAVVTPAGFTTLARTRTSESNKIIIFSSSQGSTACAAPSSVCR